MGMDSTNDSGIKWGAEIAIVDGERPEWLGEDTYVDVLANKGRPWYSEGASGLGVGADHIGWRYVKAIRLPADHPHYQKQAEAQKVDWSKPIEAVHVVSGKVVAVAPKGESYGPFQDIQPSLPGGVFSFKVDGSHAYGKWTIRNVQTPEPTPAIDPALVERMVALTKLIAAHDKSLVFGQCREEARDILMELEPVDEDLLEARQVARDVVGGSKQSMAYLNNITDGHNDRWPEVRIALAAIRRGRALERGE